MFFKKLITSLRNWLNEKPQTWENLSESERQRASVKARAQAEGVEGSPFKDTFGSSVVNPGSSQIGATVNQSGIQGVMSRRIFEPRQRPEDNN